MLVEINPFIESSLEILQRKKTFQCKFLKILDTMSFYNVSVLGMLYISIYVIIIYKY